MSDILEEVEASIVEFVKYRVPEGDLETLTSPASVLYRLEGDGEDELKDYIWSLIKQKLDWSAILEEIEHLRVNQVDEESETEEEDSVS